MNRHFLCTFSAVIYTSLLAACGGGGGGSAGPIAVTCTAPQLLQNGVCVSPAPTTVSVSLSKSKATVGSSVTLNWSSTNATTCVGLDNMTAGTQAASGSKSISPTVGGQFTYTISCDGTGGTVKNSALLIVPMEVFKTSYENKNSIPFDKTQIQSFRLLGIVRDSDEIWENPRDMTFGDFFQEGAYSAFAVSIRSRNLYGIAGLPDYPGKAYFLSLDKNGKWIDRTTELLKTPADRDVCVAASFSLTADFNNDGRPDVYVACHGLDYDLPNADLATQQRINLEHQVLFLSQKDGSYKRIDVPFNIYGHQAAIGDINGDGFMDVITTNSRDFVGQGADITPFVLLGHGDGTFTRDNSIVPTNIYDFTGKLDGIFGIQLIPIEGRLDAIIGGGNTVWLKGNKNGGFLTNPITVFTPLISNQTNRKFMFPLDVIYKDGYFYLTQLSQYESPSQSIVLKINSTSLAQNIIFSNSIPFANDSRVGSEQYKPTSDGDLIPIQGGCLYQFDDPLFSKSVCGLRIKM